MNKVVQRFRVARNLARARTTKDVDLLVMLILGPMSAVLRAQLPEAADVGLGDHLVFRIRTAPAF